MKNSHIASTLLICIAPVVAFGCGDDTSGSQPGGGGTSSRDGGAGGGSAGRGNGGKGGNAAAGTHTGGTKNYAGSDGEGGEGGDSRPNAGTGGGGNAGAGGKGGAGGTSGAGGKGGAGGASGNAGTSGGGASGAGGMSGGAGGMSGGGAGGTSGGGGTGGSGGPTCGNGAVDDGEACDPEAGKYTEDDCGAVWGTGDGETGASSACKVITPLICSMCEEQSACAPLADSSLVMGETATAGPAMGVKRAVLYNETMDCVRDTKCADDAIPIKCYCGTASDSACDAGNGNGKCRVVIERGLETTNPAEIQARYFSLDYGAGVALSRINCDQQECLIPCFPVP